MSNREFEHARRHLTNMLYWRNNVRNWSAFEEDTDLEKWLERWLVAMTHARIAKSGSEKAIWLRVAANYREIIQEFFGIYTGVQW